MNAFDRSSEDFSNIVSLEHVNTRIPDQTLATRFYIDGLGLTRDPFLNTGTGNMWVNAGLQQFHLPSGSAHVIDGTTALYVDDLKALTQRLEVIAESLSSTGFSFQIQSDSVETISPWGNRIVCFKNPSNSGLPGLPWVEFNVPQGTAAAIAGFYRQILGAPAESETDTESGETRARVKVGRSQHILFKETAETLRTWDGHHIAIYLADFSGPHQKLGERGLITEESNPYQYRFSHIIDVDNEKDLFCVEHEVRSMSHPLFNRQHINRNPAVNTRNYGSAPERLG